MAKGNRILLISDDKVYGPFPDQDTATAWLDGTHMPNTSMLSIWDAELGTVEKAHECGIRLKSIDEAVTARTSNRAAGA